MKAIVEISAYNLTVCKNRQSFNILTDINFSLYKNEITGLIGNSGSGKSMTLKSMLNLFENLQETIQSGSIIYNFEKGPIDILNTSPDTIRDLRRNKIAMVFQQSAQVLNPSQRIGVQLIERLKDLKCSQNENEVRCLEVLSIVGLYNASALIKRYPHELSGGQIQRVLIAMAIIKVPDILLVDEPTSALDQDLKEGIMELLVNLRNELNITILLVSHDLTLMAKYCDNLLVIHGGKIVESGKTMDILTFPKSEHTKELLGHNKKNQDSPSSLEESLPILRLENITKHFTSNSTLFNSLKNTVLREFNLTLREGEILGLLGDSGSGKSTIAKLIKFIIQPDNGNIFYFHRSVGEMTKKEYHQFQNEVQIIFQDPLSSLSPHRTGQQVMHEVMSLARVSKSREDLINYLSNFSLPEEVLDKVPSQLSGGQRQRLLIARALVLNPKILICDEILASLDNQVQYKIIDLLMQLNTEKKLSIIFISHDRNIIGQISHRIMELETIGKQSV